MHKRTTLISASATKLAHQVLTFILLSLALCAGLRAQTPEPVSIGSGFLVSSEGHIVTAYHVIRDKKQLLVGPIEKNRWRIAKLIKVDEALDLALLQTRIDRPPLAIARWAEVPIGLEALVIGYPQPRLQGLSLKITQGIVNGDRTESGDLGFFQLSAEVQKGNSGSPVLAPDGRVIGVVRAKINALTVAERTGDLAQNVNYALKSSSLLKFLEDTGVSVRVEELDLELASRPYQTFRKAAPSVLAIVGRNPVAKPSAPTDKASGETSIGE